MHLFVLVYQCGKPSALNSQTTVQECSALLLAPYLTLHNLREVFAFLTKKYVQMCMWKHDGKTKERVCVCVCV